MQLLDLPVELFEMILYEAIKVRGLARGVRLRLVNKLFSRAVLQIVCSFQMIDGLPNRDRNWSIKPVSRDFLSFYLQNRVTREPDTSDNEDIKNLQSVAKKIYAEQDGRNPELASYEKCVRVVCSLFLNNGDRADGEAFENNFRSVIRYGDSGLDLLLTAAIATSTLSIVKKYGREIKELIYGEAYCCGAGSLTYLAALTGNEELLAYLMTLDTGNIDTKMRTALLVAAASCGHIDTVKFVYNFKETEEPWNFSGHSISFLEVDALDEALDTPSIEVLEFIQELRKEYIPEREILIHDFRYDEQLESCLIFYYPLPICLRILQEAEAAGLSATEALSFHSILSACNAGSSGMYGTAGIDFFDRLIEHGLQESVVMKAAASSGYTALVRHLLGRGIKPGSKVLSMAAAGPFMDIVHLLLDAGADPNEDLTMDESGASREMVDHYGAQPKWPLLSAIRLEHTDLFNLLIDRGAKLHTAHMVSECSDIAAEYELESMLELLKQHGIDVKALDRQGSASL